MKNRPQSALRAASSSDKDQASNNVLSDLGAVPQANYSAVDIAHVGAIWKSPRDKRTCIQAGLKSYNGSPYCDLRIFEMDAQGRMRPTSKGLTVSPQKLMHLAKLVGDAARKAHALGLTGASS
jgi:Transcriptional Coactivator p15 (PC4)